MPKLPVVISRWLGIVGYGLSAAFLAAVCTGTVMSIAYALIEALPYFHDSDLEISGGLWFVAVNAAYVSSSIALPTILLVALPHILVSFRLRRVSMTYYVASGTVIGLAAVIAIELVRQLGYPGPPFRFDADTAFFLVTAATAGAVAAFTFWKTVNPERSIAKDGRVE